MVSGERTGCLGKRQSYFSLYVILYHLVFVSSATIICLAVLKMWSKDSWGFPKPIQGVPSVFLFPTMYLREAGFSSQISTKATHHSRPDAEAAVGIQPLFSLECFRFGKYNCFMKPLFLIICIIFITVILNQLLNFKNLSVLISTAVNISHPQQQKVL